MIATKNSIIIVIKFKKYIYHYGLNCYYRFINRVEFARTIFAAQMILNCKAAAGLPAGEMQLSLFFCCFFSHAGFYPCHLAGSSLAL